jgi:ubiquitin-protein ligase
MSTLIQHEIKKLYLGMKKEKNCNYIISNDIENLCDFNIKLKGPKNTPYQGGIFTLNFSVKNFPTEMPSVKFITKIMHPNVNYNSGTICLDILKNQWMGHSMNIKYIIDCIYNLLETPNPDDPYNIDIVNIYKKNYKKYLEEIVKCTKDFSEKNLSEEYLSVQEIDKLSK